MAQIADLSSNEILAKSCLQKSLYLAYTNEAIPRTRDNIISPYPQFNKLQLDMRRKAEILKYNQQASKVGNLTKAQKWSLLNKSKPAVRNACPISNDIIYTPSSSSNVPGKVILLYEDPQIPLYKFVGMKQDNKLTEIKYPDYSQLYETFPYTYPIFQNNVTNGISDVLIMYPIKDTYLSEVVTPFAITVTSFKQPVSQTYTVDVSFVKVNIVPESIIFDLYYSDVSVNLVQKPITRVYQTSNIVDVSYVELDINVSNTQGYFYTSQYVGYIKTTNIYLPAQPQYTYSLNYTFQYIYEEYNDDGLIIDTSTATVQNPTINIVTNLLETSDQYNNITINCSASVSNTNNNILYSPFYFDMV